MNARCSALDTICLQCGDKGFTNAFVYCVKCLKFSVHRYCLDVIPKSFDEFVRWFCDDCEMEVLNQPAFYKNDVMQSKSSDLRPSKHILDTSGVGTKKNVILALEIEEPINEGDPCQSIDACAKPDSIECVESADERKGCERSSSKRREEQKINDNLSTDAPPKESSAITAFKRAHDKCTIDDIRECAKLASDSVPSMEVKEKKATEKREHQHFQKLSGLDPEHDRDSHHSLSCNGSFGSSKKKKTNMSSEANLEEQRHRTLLAQHLKEHAHQCVSEDGNRHRESEVSEDRTSTSHNKSNIHKGFSKDSAISSMIDCNVRAKPLVKPIWSGSFNIWNKKDVILEGLMAHISSLACRKVQDEACQFQPLLHLEMFPKFNVWPECFKTSKPSDENIALYFFPSDTRCERVFDHLVDEMVNNELALKAIVQNAELLVFTSTELPLPCWRFQGKYYLWGVFREMQHHTLRSKSCSREQRDYPVMHKDGVGDTNY